jgi:hypothetical protein
MQSPLRLWVAGGMIAAVGLGAMCDSVPIALVAIGITLAVAGAAWAIGRFSAED